MIISGMEKQKRYKHVSDDDKLLVSEWTSTETVERPDNITNKDKKDVDATTLDHTYDNNNSVPTKLTDFITKSTAFFNNIRFVKNVLTTFTGANTDNTAEQMAQAMYNKIYPIGSLYWSSSPTNPQTLFGGTWVQVKDKFIMAAGDTYQAGTSGGSASINYTPAGTNTGTAITIDQMPSHSHGNTLSISINEGGSHAHKADYPVWEIRSAWPAGSSSMSFEAHQPGGYKKNGDTDTKGSHSHTVNKSLSIHNSGGDHTHTHTFNGTPTTFNNLPPYVAYYCWERTA